MMGERRIEVASILSRWPPLLFALVVSFVFFGHCSTTYRAIHDRKGGLVEA
jgi:hypothetical protein